MNVTAFLRKTKNKTKATVYFRVRDNDCNCDLKAASELSIHPQQWDSKRMGYKTRVTIISDAERLAFCRTRAHQGNKPHLLQRCNKRMA